jgi:hypothetical protein
VEESDGIHESCIDAVSPEQNAPELTWCPQNRMVPCRRTKEQHITRDVKPKTSYTPAYNQSAVPDGIETLLVEFGNFPRHVIMVSCAALGGCIQHVLCC